jgi:hypothetical protein
MKSPESTEAIAGIDDLFASVGLKPGSRATLKGSWSQGERIPRKVREAKKLHEKANSPGKARRGTAKGATEAAGKPAKKSSQKPQIDTVFDGKLSRSGAVHGFSTRPGGVSHVYRPWLPKSEGDLNLSWTKDDDPKLVAKNRKLFLAALALKCGAQRFAAESKSSKAGSSKAKKRSAAVMHLVTLRQVHSPVVQVMEKGSGRKYRVSGKEYASLATKDGRAVLRGDGVMTDVPGLLLGIQTADCIPILVHDPKSGAVAAFHAGWKPTLARIVERGIGRMQLQYGSDPKNLIAAIGPGIGPCCYAVGEEIRYEFESQFAYWKELFTEVYDEDPVKTKYPLLFLTARAPGHSPIGPQTHLNLWEANRLQLLDAGVPAKNIMVTGLCTACNTERFFSHRAERGFTGRMLNVVGKN